MTQPHASEPEIDFTSAHVVLFGETEEWFDTVLSWTAATPLARLSPCHDLPDLDRVCRSLAPTLVLIKASSHSPAFIEAVAAADGLGACRILILAASSPEREVLLPAASRLFLAGERLTPHALEAQLVAALTAEPAAEGRLRLADFLALGWTMGLSAALLLKLESKGKALVELKEGETVAYRSQVGDGEPPLLAALASPVLDARRTFLESSHLRRNIELPTIELLAGHISSKAAAVDEGPVAESFQDLFAAGLAASLGRDYAAAAKAFERALAIQPDDPRARFNLERVRRLVK